MLGSTPAYDKQKQKENPRGQNYWPTNQPPQLVKAIACNHTMLGVFKLQLKNVHGWGVRLQVSGLGHFTWVLSQQAVCLACTQTWASHIWAAWCPPALQHISFHNHVRSFRHQQTPLFTGCWAI